MVEKYLSNNGERITKTNQLAPGDICAVGWGKGYRVFKMPGENQITRSDEGDISVSNVTIYQIPSLEDKKYGPEVVVGDVHINFVTLEFTGTFRLDDKSELRSKIEKELEAVEI